MLQTARFWSDPSWCSPRWGGGVVQKKGEEGRVPSLHSMSFEGSPSPAAPRPHLAGGSSRSGFPSQAGMGQGSIHLKFLLDLCVCMGVDSGVCTCVMSALVCTRTHLLMCTSGCVGVPLSVYMCCCVQTWRSVHTCEPVCACLSAWGRRRCLCLSLLGHQCRV